MRISQSIATPAALARHFTDTLHQLEDGRWFGTPHRGPERQLTVDETLHLPDVTSFRRNGCAVTRRDRLGGATTIIKPTEAEAIALFALGPDALVSRPVGTDAACLARMLGS